MDNKIYIFGAHSRAQTLGVYLQALNPETVIQAFLYDNEEPNPKKVGNVPVQKLRESALCREYPVYIGTRGASQGRVRERLEGLGFEDIRPLTVELDSELRNGYLEKYFASGDNISAMNRQFCELTALYWIWKHAEEDVLGLVHYRRHFILPPDWLERMKINDVDVILPVPLYVAPSLEGNFKKRHDEADWNYMMNLLRE